MRIPVFIGFLLLVLSSCEKDSASVAAGLALPQPANFPAPLYLPADNPVTDAGVALGRRLFYDPILSRDSTISCASCHHQQTAFSDAGLALSPGIEGRLGKRNTPALQNLAWRKSFFWDGGVFHLDLVPLSPINNELEMDEEPATVLTKLRRNTFYKEQFKLAFGVDSIATRHYLYALAQFMSLMVSADSRYDRHVRAEPGGEFSMMESLGLDVFRQKCATCHSEPLFTNDSYRNNGLDSAFSADPGRYNVSLLPQDSGRFKVPGLRNIALTPPYMHDGRFPNLETVLNHYSGNMHPSASLDPVFIRQNQKPGIPLSDPEKQALLAFLNTLTDETFLTNPLLAP